MRCSAETPAAIVEARGGQNCSGSGNGAQFDSRHMNLSSKKLDPAVHAVSFAALIIVGPKRWPEPAPKHHDYYAAERQNGRTNVLDI